MESPFTIHNTICGFIYNSWSCIIFFQSAGTCIIIALLLFTYETLWLFLILITVISACIMFLFVFHSPSGMALDQDA